MDFAANYKVNVKEGDKLDVAKELKMLLGFPKTW